MRSVDRFDPRPKNAPPLAAASAEGDDDAHVNSELWRTARRRASQEDRRRRLLAFVVVMGAALIVAALSMQMGGL